MLPKDHDGCSCFISKLQPTMKSKGMLVRAYADDTAAMVHNLWDNLKELENAFDNVIEFAIKTEDLVPQLLKAYHESMEWYPYKFQSRTTIKNGGVRKRSKRVRDRLAAITEPSPMVVVGYGMNAIVVPSDDVTKPYNKIPMKV